MAKRISGELINEPIVENWADYENAMRARSGRPDMAKDLTEQPFNDLLSDLTGAKATSAREGYDNNVDALERRIRAATPNEAVYANASPASLADVEGEYRDDYGIPQTRPITEKEWDAGSKSYVDVTRDIPNPINANMLQAKGFDHRVLGSTPMPEDLATAEGLVDQGVIPEGLDQKIWMGDSRRYMKSPMDKTATAITLNDWLTDKSEFTRTLSAGASDFEVKDELGNVRPDLRPMGILQKHFSHLDGDQVLSGLFAAGMGGFRQERHTELSSEDEIALILDEKEGEAFVRGEEFGRPRDFRIQNKVARLIEDNLAVKLPPAEKKVLAAAVTDAIAATPSLDLSKKYMDMEGEIVGQDAAADGEIVSVFYDYSKNSMTSFARYEGFILETNPSLRIDLRTAPVPEQDYTDLTPQNETPGVDYGSSPERTKADTTMSQMPRMIDTKGLGFVSMLNSRRVAEQETVPDKVMGKFGTMQDYKRVAVDNWATVFSKTGVQVMNSVFTQAKLLAEAGTNIYYQTVVRYLNGRAGYRESVNTKNNTLLRAMSLPITAQTKINLNKEEEINQQRIRIAKMLTSTDGASHGSGKLDKATLAWYNANVDSLLPIANSIQDAISQQASGVPNEEVIFDVDPKVLGKIMSEKFDSVQALRAMSELENAVQRRDLAKKNGTDSRNRLDSFFVLEQDSTASGPSLIAQVIASISALQKTGLVPTTADINREEIIVGTEMHKANADNALMAYEAAFGSFETDQMNELEQFLMVAYGNPQDKPGMAARRVFSRGMGKGYATPAFYGSSVLSAKRSFMKDFWDDAPNQVALRDTYSSEEITKLMYQTAHFMEKGFEFANPAMIKFKVMTKIIGQKMNELGVLADWSTTDKKGDMKKDPRLIPSVTMSDGMRLPLFPTNFKRVSSLTMNNPLTGYSLINVSDKVADYERETKAVTDPGSFSQSDYNATIDNTLSSMQQFITSEYGQEGFDVPNVAKKEDVSSMTARHVVVLTIQALDNLIESKFINKFHNKYPDVYIDVIFDAVRVPAQYAEEAAKMYNEIHRTITFDNNVIKTLGEALQSSVELLSKDKAVMKKIQDEGNWNEWIKLKNFATTTIHEGKALTERYKSVFDELEPLSEGSFVFRGDIAKAATVAFSNESQNLN